MQVCRSLSALVSLALLAAGQQSAPIPDAEAALRAARLGSLAQFEGTDDDIGTPTVEEYHAHLSGMCAAVVSTVKGYPQLVRAVPDIAADQPLTPALVPGSDFFQLFFAEKAPSGQEGNYYANLTQKPDPQEAGGGNYEQRLKARILASPGKLEPAEVVRLALDATHGNYPLAMLTAHNLFKEITYVGRNQEAAANAPAPGNLNGRLLPAKLVGIEPEIGEFAGHLAKLRLGQSLDKMGPWYHFFVPLAAEAWSSRFSASSFERGEHGLRHVAATVHAVAKDWFSKDDFEKQGVDDCALQAAYDVNSALDGRPDPPVSPEPPTQNVVQVPTPVPPAQPEPPIQSVERPTPAQTAAIGSIEVDPVDGLDTDHTIWNPEVDITLTSEDASERTVFTWSAKPLDYDVPAGRYTVHAEPRNQPKVSTNVDALLANGLASYPDPWYGPAERRGVEVKPGKSTTVTLPLPNRRGNLSVTVRDEAGYPLPGIEIKVSGPQPAGPVQLPFTFRLIPGNYRVIVPESTVNGKRYRPKEGSATVVANHTVEVPVLLEPYPPPAPPPQASSISINPGWLNLNVHDDYDVGATVYDGDGREMPGAVVTWSSSAPGVASVDALGKVTGRGSGQAQVIARSANATASIAVTVNSGAVLSTCAIADHPKMLPAGGAGYDLRVVAKDTDGEPVPNVVFTWSGSNYDAALVNSKTGSITTEKPGEELTIWAQGVGPDGSQVQCDTSIMVDDSYQDVLVSGKVVQADGSAVAGATVRAMGGDAVQSDGQGNFTVLAGHGPHPEDATVSVVATLGSASGRASGQVKKGAVKGHTKGVAEGLRITLAAPANGATTGGTEGPKPNKRRINAHLFHIWPPESPKDAGFLLYAKAEKHENGLFSFPDGNGGVYWRAGEDLGLYADEDSVCAVLRGYSQTSVDYNLYWYTVTCPKEGPVAQPNRIDAGMPAGATAAASGAKPAAGAPGGSGAEEPGTVTQLSGSVTYTDPATPAGRPLRAQDTVRPGASLDVHQGSRVSVQSPNAVVTANENTQFTYMANNRAKVSNGGIEVKTRHEGPPSFAGENVRPESRFSTETPDVRVDDLGTWYKVSVSGRGTGVEMLEGAARLTGSLLSRTDANFNMPEEGKRALVQALDLKAGDRAFAFRTPSWTTGGTKPAAAGASPLDQPDPWNNPRVQQLMDQWLHTATPEIAAREPGPFRYSDWGQIIGPGITVAGPPEHPSGWTRYQSMWAVRTKFGSLNLCTLAEFVERRIFGKGLDDCAKGGGARAALPSWMATPIRSPVAPTAPPGAERPPVATAPDPLAIARAQVAKEQQQRAAPAPSTPPSPGPPATNNPVRSAPAPAVVAHNPPAPPPVPPPLAPLRPLDLRGIWYCKFQTTNSRRGTTMHFNQRPDETFTVRPGNLMEVDEHGKTLAPSYVHGNAIGYRMVLPLGDVTLTFTIDLELKGDEVIGTDKIEGTDGALTTENVTCYGRHESKR